MTSVIPRLDPVVCMNTQKNPYNILWAKASSILCQSDMVALPLISSLPFFPFLSLVGGQPGKQAWCWITWGPGHEASSPRFVKPAAGTASPDSFFSSRHAQLPRGLRIRDFPLTPGASFHIRPWPGPDPQPCSPCSLSARRSRRPPLQRGWAGLRAGRTARRRRRARIWRRRASAWRTAAGAGAGGVAARSSTTCASGPLRRGACRARYSPATCPAARHTPGSNAAAPARLLRSCDVPDRSV
jgi:hypothetical protein